MNWIANANYLSSCYVTCVEWILNNTVHEPTGHTLHELFLVCNRYNPFCQIVHFPSRVSLPQSTKLTMAAKVYMSKSEVHRKRHELTTHKDNLFRTLRKLVFWWKLTARAPQSINVFKSSFYYLKVLMKLWNVKMWNNIQL